MAYHSKLKSPKHRSMCLNTIVHVGPFFLSKSFKAVLKLTSTLLNWALLQQMMISLYLLRVLLLQRQIHLRRRNALIQMREWGGGVTITYS